MASPLQIFNIAAGNPGSPYLKVLSFPAKAAGNYVINDTNFAGVGKFLPGWVTVTLAPAAGGTALLQISTDNGTTWKTLVNAVGTAAAGSVTVGGLVVYCDAPGISGQGPGVSTNATIRVSISAAASDVFLWPIGI